MNFLVLALAINFSDPASLVEAASASSPTLARLRAEAAAGRERVEPAAQLPNPMLMAGVQNKQIDLSDDPMMTMYMVGASQTIVRPSKRESRRNVAQLEARAAELRIDSARAEIERDVRMAWWEIATADEQLRNAEAVGEMINAIVAAARVRYEVGSAAQADVIRAQLQVSELESEIVRLRGMRRAAVARLLPLLGLPPDSAVPALDPPEEAIAIEAPIAVAPEAHPGIAAIQAEVARQEEQIRLIGLELEPDIDIEAQYGFRRAERDMFSVTARVELPFLRREKTIEPQLREAMLMRDAAKTRIEELRRDLSRDLGVALAAHAESREQLELLDEVLMPQSKLAFDSTLAAYQTGAAPFDAILTAQTELLRLHLQFHELLLRNAQAAVSYEALRRGAGSMQ